jgi:Zinc carboxypeptidase
MKIPVLFLLVGFFPGFCQPSSIQSPSEFLGYPLGERFTSHQRMIEYFHYVDDHSSLVQITSYGETYEHRPLIYAVVSSEENMKSADQLRQDNLKRARMISGTASLPKTSIVWLSYNVHGNEASSQEAAMKTLYELVNPVNASSKERLKNTIVIIDPCLNPDGHERYIRSFEQLATAPATKDPQSAEHHEPWPGGRGNHYLTDLNRDWTWINQAESQARVKAYGQWLPHVHVDFHEQGSNTPYYFAPGAKPYHTEITPWQHEFQAIIGKNNAKYFDEQGWLYFTKERYDLFYPGYGDTYPLLNGAIGMTYEKGGGGSAGLTVTTSDGDVLTLKDRLEYHFTTGMSTIEAASNNVTRIVDEFEKYFNTPSPSKYKSYVIKSDNNPDRIQKLIALLEAHGIHAAYAANSKSSSGFNFLTGTSGAFSVDSHDIIISADQPKGKLITVLLDPQPVISDSLTYDITAWNLLYAYNLKAFAATDKITTGKPFVAGSITSDSIQSKPYAYLFRYQSVRDAELLGSLLQQGIRVRSTKKSFTIGEQQFDPGTLIIARGNNSSIQNFDDLIRLTAKKMGRPLIATSTGYANGGLDLGSDDVNLIRPPKIAVLGGSEAFSAAFGEVWHFFEQTLHYPVVILRTDYFKTADLWRYTVLIVPDGRYKIFDEATLENIRRWIQDGGKLILMESSVGSFAGEKGFELREFATEDLKKEIEKKEQDEKLQEGPLKYGEAERKALSKSISGAIYKITLDGSHPLAFSLGDDYYTLKTDIQHFDFLESGWNVGTIRGPVKPVIGFGGYNANKKLNNSLVFGVESKGKGQIIYLIDNPLFRGFWENGKMLFANAVFMVGM